MNLRVIFRTSVFTTFVVGSFFLCLFFVSRSKADDLITTVTIQYCGDGNVQAGELCDDGVNSGAYSITIADRKCAAGCMSWGPHCGDAVLQSRYSEQCDDGNNTSGDYCSDLCQAEPIPSETPAGGGGGSGGGGGIPRGEVPQVPLPSGVTPSTNETKVIIKGKAYPGTEVNILMDGSVLGKTKADTNADFSYSTTEISPGTATFGFWAADKKGVKSLTLAATFEIVQSAVNNISGVLLPPTISLSSQQLNKGDLLNIEGESVPDVKIVTHISSEEPVILDTRTDKVGVWALQFNTESLENESEYSAKAYFELSRSTTSVVQSGFSRSAAFYIGKEGLQPKDGLLPDINKDGFVNLIDFSIFLIDWGTSETRSDFNEDTKVNLADFSIMLFYWTG